MLDQQERQQDRQTEMSTDRRPSTEGLKPSRSCRRALWCWLFPSTPSASFPTSTAPARTIKWGPSCPLCRTYPSMLRNCGSSQREGLKIPASSPVMLLPEGETHERSPGKGKVGKWTGERMKMDLIGGRNEEGTRRWSRSKRWREGVKIKGGS